MRSFTILGATIVLASLCGTHADAADCKSIQSPTDRLKCYDAKDAPVAANTARMDLVDFKTDKAKLKGKPVELAGVLMNFSDNALLSTSVGDMNPVWIDIRAVDRDQRRKLLSCTSSCRGVVRGTVGTVSIGQIGVVADGLTIEDN